MTPKELKARAQRLAILQDELRLLSHNQHYGLINPDGECFVRKDGATVSCSPDDTMMIKTLFAAVVRNMIEKRDEEIKQLCDPNTPDLTS